MIFKKSTYNLILASIFAATMSTADSQVLACTAAITDDVIPEWSTDHKKTKITTMVMAFVATCLSLGAYFSGNNSVFSLVVLAVYGLGGMFIPLILVRMSGYKPSSQHSILMMTAALVAVIFWRVKGYNEHIFESVPGMGAAFIVHFILILNENKDHWLEKLPEKSVTASFIVGILVLIIPVEYYYANNAPTSMSSSTPDPDSMWNLSVEFEYSYAEETILISDGSTDSFYFDLPEDAVSALFMLNYSESNEGGLGSQCDSVESSYDATNVPREFNFWNLQNLSGENCGENSLGGFSTWSSFSEIDTYENQQSAINSLMVEKESGEIVFNVNVNVNTATPVNGDSGEEVTISIQYAKLVSYDLTEAE